MSSMLPWESGFVSDIHDPGPSFLGDPVEEVQVGWEGRNRCRWVGSPDDS